VIHRIEKIKTIDGVRHIITKGDNNKEVDDWVVLDEDIIGLYKFKIPYIGYPTALIHKLFGRG
jgi:signal peptidase I